jgi:hypothetical protein
MRFWESMGGELVLSAHTRELGSSERDENLWNEIAEELAKNSTALRAYYADMPSRFESSLQLSQLV